MQYEIVTLQETKVAGFTARTNNASPDMGAVIGGVWQKFFAKGGYADIPHQISAKTMGSIPITKAMNTAIIHLWQAVRSAAKFPIHMKSGHCQPVSMRNLLLSVI